MKSKTGLIMALIAIAVIAVIWGASSYNSMVGKDEAVTAQWAQVQNAYQRRGELIPNLVATVKGYATHEQETLIGTVEARAKATQMTLKPDELTPENLQKYQQAQGELGSALGRLMMIREAYPDLKANQNFIQLQDELTGTENRIAVERNKFNELAKEYNAYIRKFPRNIFAGIFGFDQKAYFEAEKEYQTAPKVSFD